MKPKIQAFALATILFILIFTRQSSEKISEISPLDDKIRVSSLAQTASITPSEPEIPFLEIIYDNQSITGAPEVKPTNSPIHIKVNAASALIVDLTDDENLLEYNLEIRRPLASLSKLMSAIIAAESVGFQKLATITEDDVLAEGNAGNFSPGETFTIGDLVKAALVVSSNDAADAIARFYGYGNFIQAMNKKAGEIGLKNTTFEDPSGLSFINQGTANDLKKLMGYISDHHASLLRLTTEKETTIEELGRKSKRSLININAFSGQADFMGGKTGYTPLAQGNLISIFNYQGRKLLFIVLGAEDRFAETKRLYEWTQNMLEYYKN